MAVEITFNVAALTYPLPANEEAPGAPMKSCTLGFTEVELAH